MPRDVLTSSNGQARPECAGNAGDVGPIRGKGERCPLSSSGNQAGRDSSASRRAPAPPRQIPAAPSTPRCSPRGRADGLGHRPTGDAGKEDGHGPRQSRELAEPGGVRHGAAVSRRWTPPASRVRVAIRFTSRGAKAKAISECWDNRCSGDGHFEILIRPDLAHA